MQFYISVTHSIQMHILQFVSCYQDAMPVQGSEGAVVLHMLRSDTGILPINR